MHDALVLKTRADQKPPEVLRRRGDSTAALSEDQTSCAAACLRHWVSIGSEGELPSQAVLVRGGAARWRLPIDSLPESGLWGCAGRGKWGCDSCTSIPFLSRFWSSSRLFSLDAQCAGRPGRLFVCFSFVFSGTSTPGRRLFSLFAYGA